MADSYFTELGARLSQARAAAEMTQQDLADRLGLTRSSIANIEAGRQPVYPDRVITCARLLGVDAMWLLTGQQPDGVPQPPVVRPAVLRLLAEDLERAAYSLRRLAAGGGERR